MKKQSNNTIHLKTSTGFVVLRPVDSDFKVSLHSAVVHSRDSNVAMLKISQDFVPHSHQTIYILRKAFTSDSKYFLALSEEDDDDSKSHLSPMHAMTYRSHTDSIGYAKNFINFQVFPTTGSLLICEQQHLKVYDAALRQVRSYENPNIPWLQKPWNREARICHFPSPYHFAVRGESTLNIYDSRIHKVATQIHKDVLPDSTSKAWNEDGFCFHETGYGVTMYDAIDHCLLKLRVQCFDLRKPNALCSSLYGEIPITCNNVDVIDLGDGLLTVFLKS
jgi:hypothetical protein